MARTNKRGRNNNPEGRNSTADGWTRRATSVHRRRVRCCGGWCRCVPWSRRNQISDQIGNLGPDQRMA